MIDAHNHLQDPRFEGQQDSIIKAMQQTGITSCVVNGTRASDWPAVAELAETHPDFVLPSFGLHPWRVKTRQRNWLEKLREYLQRFPESGVGEVGLDRWIEGHDIEDQQTVFRAQLDLATELDRPCTIHCLKAWGQLLEELGSREKLPRILVHSFGGSLETARKLANLGAWFSFSGYFLHPRKEKTIEVFRQLPQDRILVETDAPDMLPPEDDRPFGNEKANHPANLAQISRRLAELTTIPVWQLHENTIRWWGKRSLESDAAHHSSKNNNKT